MNKSNIDMKNRRNSTYILYKRTNNVICTCNLSNYSFSLI